MSSPSCCYYISSTSVVTSLFGIFQTDASYTQLDRSLLGAVFAANGAAIAEAFNTSVESNFTDNTALTAILAVLSGEITASGAAYNRDGSPIDSIDLYATWKQTKVLAGTSATDPSQSLEVVSYFETILPVNPIRNLVGYFLHVGLPVLHAGVAGLAIHIVISATKNEGYIPCIPPTIPPTNVCSIPCEDDDPYDDCEDDEECVNIFARTNPSAFFGGVYRFA